MDETIWEMAYPLQKKNGIHYILDEKGRHVKYKPWLGDQFAFLYDRIMERSIFPKLFGGSISRHFEILRMEFENVHDKSVLELSTGSGILAGFLPADNTYAGIDISRGLLKKALKRFKKHGFADFELYVSSYRSLPFMDNSFDRAVCILSLNFYDDAEGFLQELIRVMKPSGVFFCCVPVPERKPVKSSIRGTLHTESGLKAIFEQHNFEFESLPYVNGAVLYFQAVLRNKNALKEAG